MAAMIAQNAVSGKTLRRASGAAVKATSNGSSRRAGGGTASAATVAAAASTASKPTARRETGGRGSVDRANATARATPARTGPRLLSLTSSLSPRLPRAASPSRATRLRLADDSPAENHPPWPVKMALEADAGKHPADLPCHAWMH